MASNIEIMHEGQMEAKVAQNLLHNLFWDSKKVR
jgi:hypothetical protein